MTWALSKLGDYYVDQNGISWNDPAEWLWSGILKGCICGDADPDLAVEVLRHYATDLDDESRWTPRGQLFHLMAHWLTAADLLEHGGSVYGSWLTDTGQQVWNAIRACEMDT